MSDDQLLDDLFKYVQAELNSATSIAINTPIGLQLHRLAEARHAATLTLLIPLLDHPDSELRLDAVQLIGFHYPLDTDVLVEKLQYMLQCDPSPWIRLALVFVMGRIPLFPVDVLETTVATDMDADVRQEALLLLLKHYGLNEEQIQKIIRILKRTLYRFIFVSAESVNNIIDNPETP